MTERTTMTPASSPPTRRRLVVDPRLVIGVGLVIASVAGVLALVSAADRRVPVYVASSTLVPGARVDAGDLLLRQVALDDAAGLYLVEGALPSGGLLATAVVREGELVPLSALGTAEGSDATTIVLQLAGRASSSVVPGALVDVWASTTANAVTDALDDGTGSMPPIVLTSGALVTRVLQPDGIVSAADGEAVEVLVPRSRIARLLQAIADGDALAVVPAGIPFDAP
ncbi:MAG: hypothetical protein KF727_02355 [Microbacteriaceae bacterium]|nr:hypothetical protein [Microbacteriaceae bacterium]